MGIPVLSDILSRAKIAWRAGLQFEGKRDLYDAFGWKRVLSHEDFLTKYIKQDIAKRVIDAPARATWTDFPKVTAKNARFNKAWEELVDEHDIPFYLTKADVFAGLGQYSILVLGFDDMRKMDQPVNAARQNKLLYIQPYLELSVTITKFEEDTKSPRFGQPVMYTVQPGELRSAMSSTKNTFVFRNKFDVHWSRVVHVADNTLENGVLGHSRLEPIYNVLDDMLKVTGGSSETYWLTSNRGMQVDVDKEMELSPEDAEELSAEIEEYQHQLRRFIRTRGTKITNLGSDVANPANTFDVLLTLLAASTNIPKRVLMGAEAGQLASQQDRANWAVFIAERVKAFAEPGVLKPFIKALANANVIPTPVGLEFDWPDAYKMSPLERAQTAAQMARSMANVTKALDTCRNAVGVTVFSPEEARKVVGFGKHMPVFGDKMEGTELPEKEPEPVNVPFGGKPAAPPAKAPTAKKPVTPPKA